MAEDALAAYPQNFAMQTAHIASLTAPDGPVPLAEEEVQHYGTVQKYLCYQRGPNSIINLTLPELYTEAFARFSHLELLVYEQERLTYGKAGELAGLFARELRASYGIKKGDCVAIAGRNHPDWVIAFLAVTGFLNAVALTVNSYWNAEELEYGMEDSKSVLLIADWPVLERFKKPSFPQICMRGLGKAQPPAAIRQFGDVVEAGRRQLGVVPLQPVGIDDPGMLMYTSGTTNKPKGVLLTHRGIMTVPNVIKGWSYNPDPAPQSTTLLASPLFHVNGSHVGLLAAIATGGKLAMLYKWDPTRALELIQAEKISNITGVPSNTYDLVNHPDLDKYDTSSMKGLGGGGAAFVASMIPKVRAKFRNANAGTGYGLTETNAASVTMSPLIFPAKPASCGFPTPHTEVCILGESNEKLPPGQMGEICLRGCGIMKEYFGKPEKTAEVFHIDTEGRLWFRSGDLGSLDEDGFVYITDRAKDIIIRGGENISCKEIESALVEHPAVTEAAAIGLPDARLGEVVGAAVTLRANVPAPSAEELIEHAKARLAIFKVPTEIFIWEGTTLPRGTTGKTQKRDIREALLTRRGPAPGGTPSPASKL